MGIVNSFPTLDGNHISSDEEQQQDSDPYIGVAFGSTYWNKGGSGFYLDIYTTYDPEDVLIHPNIPKKGLKNVSKWPTKMADITIRIQVIPDP